MAMVFSIRFISSDAGISSASANLKKVSSVGFLCPRSMALRWVRPMPARPADDFL